MPASSVDEEPAGTDGVSGLTLTAVAAVALSSAFKVEAEVLVSTNAAKSARVHEPPTPASEDPRPRPSQAPARGHMRPRTAPSRARPPATTSSPTAPPRRGPPSIDPPSKPASKTASPASLHLRMLQVLPSRIGFRLPQTPHANTPRRYQPCGPQHTGWHAHALLGRRRLHRTGWSNDSPWTVCRRRAPRGSHWCSSLCPPRHRCRPVLGRCL